jgi:hypothetical protein
MRRGNPLIYSADRKRGGVPVAGRGQQGERMRRVGVLMGFEESSLEAKAFLSALRAFSSFMQWPSGRPLAKSGVRYEAAAIH